MVINAGESFYFLKNINIFHDIDYITYINVGHGVKYFKRNSYIHYITKERFNKIMLLLKIAYLDGINIIFTRKGFHLKNLIRIYLFLLCSLFEMPQKRVII